MKVILWKLIRDFKHAKGKLLLLLLAAGLSGWGISSVAYGYFMTERDFEENFEQTYPADMTLVVENYRTGLEEVLLSDKNVVDIERREVITARIKNNEDSWMPVIIYALDDLSEMRYDRIKILDDENQVANKLLIDKNAYYFLSEDQKQIELLFKDRDETVMLDLAGKVHDARQAPARMEGIVYAYATSTEVIGPFLEQGRRRLLIKTNVSSDKGALEVVSKRLKVLCEKEGGKIVSVNIPTPGKHIHQGIVDGISFLQESGGIILSLMGIILLALILLTWIFPQVADIGVMKAIGASTQDIFKSYTLVLIGIVFVGLLVGLPLGYQTAAMYSKAVAFFQNFEVVTDVLPLQFHLIVVFVSMIVPLSFGILPLLRSSKTSVNEAFNKTFYVPHRGFFRISQTLISSTQLKYGLNNLFRHSQRTALTMLLLAVGMALYFTAANVEHSIRVDLRQYAETSPYEIVVALPDKVTRSEVAYLDELEFVDQALAMNTSRVAYFPPNLGNSEFSFVRTLSLDFDVPDSFIVRGEVDKTCSDCVYVGGEEMKKNFEDVPLGTSIELTNVGGEIRTYKFSGVVKDLVVIGAPFLTFDTEVADSFNGLAFKLRPDLPREEVLNASNAIDDLFIDNGVNIRALSSVSRRLGGILGHLDPTFLIIKITGIFTIVLGLFGLLIVLNLTIQERTREIGIMKSMGSPFRKISGMFKQEFLLISLFAVVVGAMLAVPVATALIGVIAETIIRHPVAFENDYYTLALTTAVALVAQTLLISLYNRWKIGKNARELLDHNF
ncbi:MAG: FtsX-like permease family protein [Cyclobacteriaceae bacterium]